MARAPRLPARERRRRILEAARRIFATAGYANVGTADLAKAAGVSEACLYRYFNSKRDLFIASLGSAGGRLLEVWQQMAAEVEDPLDILRATALGYYDHARSRSGFMRLQFRALAESDDAEIREALRGNFRALIRFLTDALEEGKRRGLVSHDIDSPTVAWQFLSIGLAVDIMYLLGFDRGVDRQRVERWSDLFIRSLRPRSEVDLEKAMQMVRKVFPLWQPLGRDMPAGVQSYAAEGAESDRLSWREADR
jgi:AcrR family transcriptional regulator